MLSKVNLTGCLIKTFEERTKGLSSTDFYVIIIFLFSVISICYFIELRQLKVHFIDQS